jgi:hypothetical protein
VHCELIANHVHVQLGVKEVALPKLGSGKDGATQADAGRH